MTVCLQGYGMSSSLPRVLPSFLSLLCQHREKKYVRIRRQQQAVLPLQVPRRMSLPCTLQVPEKVSRERTPRRYQRILPHRSESL